MPSIYVSHRGNQLPDAPSEEGIVYPLLRKVDDSHLNWAFAVPQPTELDSLEKRRKNRLVCGVLQAIGFVLDEKNATSGKPFDFYCLPDMKLVDSLNTRVFDAATLPALSGEPANLEIRDPVGGELKLASAARQEIKADAQVKVHHFAFANTGGLTPGHFELGVPGQPTDPGFVANITLEPKLKSEFPNGILPVLTIDQQGVLGALRCNNVSVIASNSMPGNANAIVNDSRHDRLTLDVATLVCTEPDTKRKLAIEVFPAISFQPDKNIPVSVSISNDGVCMRLQPRVELGDALHPRLTVNRFKPCIHVTVRGPLIHADASSSGVLEALRLLEPAERKFEDTVEQINDFMVYSFSVCLPEKDIPKQELAELLRFEKLGVEVPNWPDISVSLESFGLYLQLLTGGLRLIKLGTASQQIEFSLEEYQLPGLELGAMLSLPSTIADWKIALRSLAAPGLELPIVSAELAGFKLTVKFSKEIDSEMEFALQLPRFSLSTIRLLDVGLPALTEYDFRQFSMDGNKLTIEFPSGLEGLLPAQSHRHWTVRVKRPNGMEFDLLLKAVKVAGLKVEFTIDGELPGLSLRVGIDILRIKWSIPFKKPDLKVNKLELELPFPRLRLPEVQGPSGLIVDYRRLTIRVQLHGISLATYTINKILDLGTFQQLELNIPEVNKEYPDLEPLTRPGVSLEFGLDLSLPLSKSLLSDLLGDLGAVDFRLSVPRLALPHLEFGEFRAAFGSLSTPVLPLELIVRVPHPTKPTFEWDELKLVLGMRFDLSELRLLDNRIYFFLPQRRSFGESNLAPRQVVDFDIFTLTFPNRAEPLGFPTIDNHDGYLDFTSREFVVDLKYQVEPTPPPRIHAFFPGGMHPLAGRLGREGVENLAENWEWNPDKHPEPKVTRSDLLREYKKRFDLELDKVDPKLWPNAGPDGLMFRFNSNGLTFAANLGKTEVEIDASGFGDDGSPDGNLGGLIKPFKCQPQEKQRELRSRVVIIDNELKEAGVYAKTEVPGVENLMAEVSVVLRQRQKGMLPDVLASMELERADEAPLAEFSIKLLELSLDRLELGLIWRMQEKEWDYSILADGTIGFTGATALVPDLEGLRVPSIQVVGLNLRKMNLRQLRVPIQLVKPVRFDILDGMFGVELDDLEIGWEFDGTIPKPRLLACELAKLTFKNPGVLEVSVSVGGLHIEFDESLKARVRLPSSLGIEVALGTSARFAGRVGWVDNKETGERYLFASGKLMLEGLPEVRGLLKFGTGLKFSGRPEINLVLYGEMDLDQQLFAGAVVKSLGVGVGLNNRLAALPPMPSADAILRRIELVKPGEVEGWQFVREGGFYMSVIGSVTLASNLGAPSVLNAYVASLVVSIDSNFDLVAAGKLWLSCSVKGQKENPNNPAFIGAMVLSPRQRKLEVVLESRKNAYVEKNDLIKKLLDKGFVRFAFRMTPQLVDYHLAEVSYRDQMFGAQVEVRGEYRFAIFKRAVLLKNELSATGSISKSLRGGSGGFDLDGQVYLQVGYGGLLSDRGAMAYAFIEAGIRFRVSAWIEIGFSISFKICGKRYSKSWTIVFRTRVPQLELTLRGHVAIADRGGFGGFDLLVGINVPIGGYRLNVSVGWAVNAELYQEVRSIVAAFEAELEAAVTELDKSDTATSFALAMASVQSEAMTKGNIELASVPPESWILYTRESELKSTALLMPSPEGRWLTPTMATIREVRVEERVTGKVLAFEIGKDLIGLPTEKIRVRLLGLRSRDSNQADVVSKLNGSWDGRIVGERVELEVMDPPADSYSLLAGAWYIEETVKGFASQDHDTVPYLNEVERVALRIEPWIGATLSGSILATTERHDFPLNGKRVLLRRLEGPVVDTGRLEVTVLAKPVDGQPKQLELVDFSSSDGGVVDYEFASAIEIAPTWSARNRIAAFRESEEVGQYRDWTGAAAVWAETAAKANVKNEVQDSSSSYAVIFDERYTSTDPRFAPLDAPVAPGVLSTRFRPLDDVEAVGVDDVLEAARRFEEASKSVARQQMHGAFDLDDNEAIRQGRARMTQLLVHRLTAPRGPSFEDRPEAPFVSFNEMEPHKIQYGWFCEANKETWGAVKSAIRASEADRKDVLYVRRSGCRVEEAAVKLPASVANNKPILLPIRQDFVIDDASADNERGRVIVRLPIRYPDGILRRHPQEIGRLQVYRRIGVDGPEELIFDELRPNISQLDTIQVYSKSRQQFVDWLPTADENNDFVMVGEWDPHTRTLTIDRSFAALLPSQSQYDREHPLQDLKCRIEENLHAIEKVQIDNGNLELTLAGSVALQSGVVDFMLHADGLIVPRPVLISDEFAVVDRRFSTELRALLESGRGAQIYYSLVVLSEDEVGGLSTSTRIPWPAPVPLHIPVRKEPLPNLALAIPVESLFQFSRFGVTFQLVDLSDETPKLAERNNQPLSAEEFEFWLDGDVLRQSGFYAGETTDRSPPREGDGEYVTLDAVNSTDGMESTAGKVRLGVKSLGFLSSFRFTDEREELTCMANHTTDELVITNETPLGVVLRRNASVRFSTTGTPPGNLVSGATYYLASVETNSNSGEIRVKLADNFSDAVAGKAIDLKSNGTPKHRLETVFTLPPGSAFRMFFRKKGDENEKTLRRLPILLVRKSPEVWDSTVRYRLIDSAEIIPEAHLESIQKGVATPHLVDFSADDRYEAGKAAIRSVWPSPTLLEGGVELQFRDFDDSSIRSRSQVEVLEADEFSTSQYDFRDDTFWIPRPSDRVERYVSRIEAKADDSILKDLKPFYLWRRSGGVIDVVRRLKEALAKLKDGNPWYENATAIRNVQTALLAFEKSPLNLNRVATRQLIELLRLTMRAVIVGNKVGANSPVKIEDARATNQSLMESLTRIEQSRAETVTDTDANDVAFLDRDTARRLAGIARRRIAIADEALALQKLEAIAQVSAMLKAEGAPELVRMASWDEFLHDAKSLAGETLLPMTDSFVSRFFSKSEEDTPRNQEAVQLCRTLIDSLLTNIGDLELERFVPRAAGLSELLHQLNERIRVPDTPAGLLKRPHHELTTTRTEDGEVIPREVPLRTLLPARARQAKIGEIPMPPDESLERLSIRAGHVATLFEDGTVAIWSTRGKSVQDEPMERVQYFSIDAGKLSNVCGFELSEVADGPRLLIAAKIDDTSDVQYWDAGQARVLRKYGYGIGATLAHTGRGAEVAIVVGRTVLLESTEVPTSSEPTKVMFQITQDVLDRLASLYDVNQAVIELLTNLKDGKEHSEKEFREQLAALSDNDAFLRCIPLVMDQAQNPTSVRPPLRFMDGVNKTPLAGPVAYHDEIQVVAAARGNEILFWRDMGRPENKTPFYRLPLQFEVHLVPWKDWESQPNSSEKGQFIAAVDPVSDFLHIRRIDALGGLVDTFEVKEGGVDYLRSQDQDGNIQSSELISGLSEDKRRALTFLRESVKQFLACHVLGQQERRQLHDQAALITGLVLPSVTHIKPVVLPAGAGFLIATKDYPKALFFFSPIQQRPQMVAVHTTAASVEQLAVDRRELRVSAVIDKKVLTYDLVSLEPRKAASNANHVAILHGRESGENRSYLVYSADRKVNVARLPANPDVPAEELIQTLPEPQVLCDAPSESKVISLASALQTARSAHASADLLSLFHLWERLGFSLDIAAQDSTNRLLTLKELREQIHAAIGQMNDQVKKSHFIYVVEGEEPDAEFRNDRVGFSHINIAVVPKEFIAACLEPNFDALKVWLKNRSITLAHEESTADSSNVRLRAEKENQRELEYIVHLSRLVGVPDPTRFGRFTERPSESSVLLVGEVHVQPRSDRFVRVPASAGFSHWSWTLPDRKGHRMLVAARRMSRYEPLLRWYRNINTRFDLPEEVALRKLGSSETEHVVTSVSGDTLSINTVLEPATNWQPLRIEISAGAGIGQRREALEITSEGTKTILKIDAGDPWLVALNPNTTKCRVIDAAPGWRLVVLDAIHDPAFGEGARPLMVYQYPHSRKPRFSYQIPLDGMRATYNQISRVRTGYDGIEAAFRYFFPDRMDDPDAATLAEILNEITSSNDSRTIPLQTVTNVAGGAEPNVRLFRHERMVCLPGLPFFYRYRLDVRSAYKARQLEWDRMTSAERLPDDEIASPSAQRLPSLLGLNEMALRPLVLSGKLPDNQPSDPSMVRLFADGRFGGKHRLRVRPTGEDGWIERTVSGWDAGVLTVDPIFGEQPSKDWEYELTTKGAFEAVLYLSSNRDHLTREESRSEPQPIKVRVLGKDIEARHLPDLLMDYHLYRNRKDGEGPLPSQGDLFSLIGSIRMPWSPNFHVPATFPDEARMRPFVSVTSGLQLLDISGGVSPVEKGQEASVAIEHVTISGVSYWRIRFGIVNEPGQDILARKKIYIQANRDGKLTRVVQCAMPE